MLFVTEQRFTKLIVVDSKFSVLIRNSFNAATLSQSAAPAIAKSEHRLKIS